jgi:hypothetical protein
MNTLQLFIALHNGAKLVHYPWSFQDQWNLITANGIYQIHNDLVNAVQREYTLDKLFSSHATTLFIAQKGNR